MRKLTLFAAVSAAGRAVATQSESCGAVPLIDVGPSFEGKTSDGYQEVAEAIGRACREMGFFLVTNHGVREGTMAALVEETAAFFARPLEEKLATSRKKANMTRGYTASSALAASVEVSTPRDLCEYYSMSRFDEPGSAEAAGFKPGREGVFASNEWPKRADKFKKAWLAYYEEMESLADHLLSLMARALGLADDWFVPFCDQHITNLVGLYYPPQPVEPLPNQWRRGQHTDFGSLTLLYRAQHAAGLQVEHAGAWIDVPDLPGALVVNVADLMAVWTNGTWRSALHRVANPPTQDRLAARLSFAFFHQPNYDAPAACVVPTTCDRDESGESVVTSGDWVTRQIRRVQK